MPARGTFYQKEVELAKEILAKNDLQFDELYFNTADKLPACLKENIDYMIDDSSDNVRRLSENGIKCLYFRDYGSVNVNNDVIDVANWGEIYRFFSEQMK